MSVPGPFQQAALASHPAVRAEMEALAPDAMGDALRWLREHFRFASSQQIDWAHDTDAVIGNVSDLNSSRVLELLNRYGVKPDRRVLVTWAYGEWGVILPVRLVAEHLDDIWYPATDDVFVFDPHDVWCLELHHEGQFGLGRYDPRRAHVPSEQTSVVPVERTLLDDSEPSIERQTELRAAYEANIAQGRAPYADTRIRTRGELLWILRERGWGRTQRGRDTQPRTEGQINLSEAILSGANLAGIRLLGANLSQAVLVNTSLDEAILAGASMAGSNLSGASLRYAQCTRADVSNADFTGADLSYSILSRANLAGAHLANAKLIGAVLRRADLEGVNLEHVDLSQADLR